MSRQRLSLVLSAAALFLAFESAAYGQQWPTQRVTIVNPLPAGGAVDIVARTIAPLLEQKWGQPVIVENRPGAGMMLASNYVARSAPEANNILIAGDINGLRLFMKVEFAESDLKPAVQLVRGAYLVTTNADIPARTLAEFISYAKAHPKALNFGTIPNTTFDLDYAYFEQSAGVEMTAIPYQGTVLAAAALSKNELQFFFGVPTTVAPHVAAGRVTVLATTSAKRMELYPNVPTARELGVDFDTGYDFGFYAQGRTPDAVVARIGADSAAVVKMPGIAAKFRDMGFESSGLQSAAWAEEKDRHMRIYTDLARKAGIKPQ